MEYKVIRWPNDKGGWWLVAVTGKDASYTPILELHPVWTKRRYMAPTYKNQLFMAAELLTQEGLDGLERHAMVGSFCACQACFTCAALYVHEKASEVATRV